MDNKETVLQNKYSNKEQEKVTTKNSEPGNRLNLNVLLDRLKKQKNNEKKLRIVAYFVALIILAAIISFYIIT